VAREVHDDVLQRIALLRAEVEVLQGIPPAERRAIERKLGALVDELDDLSHVLRSVARRLHPSTVEQAGLVAALRQLVTDVAGLGLQVTLEAPDAPVPLRLDRALAAYRIAQEALRNVARHAGSRDAALALELSDGHVVLRISDRGRGFQPASNRQPGIGMVGMQERAALAGGYFQVRSEPGQGTVVQAAFPLDRS
jgi:signal transduction histidine kinase